jgi:tetratricopeptide (TPR) repeat protein
MLAVSSRHVRAALLALGVMALVGSTSTLARAQRAAPPHGGRDAGSADAGPATTADAGDPERDATAAEHEEGAPAESFDERQVQAGAEFAEGLAAYRRGDFVAAAEHFQNAYLALPHPAPLFNLARSWEGANEISRALEAYERYLVEAPTAPDRNEVVERIAMLRARPAQVFISSEPPGARVFLDDDPSPQPGITPMVVRLPPGPHVLVLEREGHARIQRRFAARPGEVETISLTLVRAEEGVELPPRPEPAQRILARRRTAPVTPRFAFTVGAARPWASQPLSLSIAGEAGVFLGRWTSARVRFERIEPDGVWSILTGEFGVVYPLEDIDLSLYASVGTAYGWLEYQDSVRQAPQQWVGVAGIEARVDWAFHPRLSLGAVFRLMARNFFVAPLEPLNSFGLSVSLHL